MSSSTSKGSFLLLIAFSLLVSAVGPVNAQCPLGLSVEDACLSSSPICNLFSDGNEDDSCDNPTPGGEPESEEPEPDGTGVSTGSLGGAAGPCCPLGFGPEEACSASTYRCALYEDSDANGRCDNPSGSPVEREDCTIFVGKAGGCPLYLTQESACPYDVRLCPHWFGRTSTSACINPTRGITRASVVLVVTLVMLIGASIVSRKRWGRHGRRTIRSIHMVFFSFSVIVLGFLVQGCFCPLGASQYLFVAGGVAFLGWVGIALALLPIVYTLAFGRVFCSWVCPMGALQELLHRIPAPKVPPLPRKLDKALTHLRYVVLVAVVLIPVLLLPGPRGAWPAIFCTVDPFHTVFSLFMAGSIWVAVALIVVSIFWRRFFCRHLCFYGAVLTLACRGAHLLGIRKLFRPHRYRVADVDDTEEPCEIEEAERRVP